ncbi:hypothetical protein [Synechococcus sp. CBW1006]|uniref:hypothetical protein n=1 Tax=Synechococcus sp. CBW1006 TaxID=1353138 RepID=UPI0018CF52C4|nr:hypothetical protein [Synechococcus sp. CBW1006]QPN65922.1 hypothetical protein H8F26_13790 [Synechococcus sp. CBW1006]
MALQLKLWNCIKHDGSRVLVAMPGCCHMAIASTEFLKSSDPGCNVYVILNGVTAWEAKQFKQSMTAHNVRVIQLQAWPGLNGAPLPHCKVLNILIMSCSCVFWAVDHDCFVLNNALLLQTERQLLHGRNVAASLFSSPTSINHVNKPHTFLVCINPPLMRKVFSKYHISACPTQWATLSSEARKCLLSLGFSEDMKPEPRAGCWADTLATAALLAYQEGTPYYFPRSYPPGFHLNQVAIHFGNTSNPEFSPLPAPYDDQALARVRYSRIGAYAWRMLLERPSCFGFKEKYLSRRPDLSDQEKLECGLRDAKVPQSLISDIKSLISSRL